MMLSRPSKLRHGPARSEAQVVALGPAQLTQSKTFRKKYDKFLEEIQNKSERNPKNIKVRHGPAWSGVQVVALLSASLPDAIQNRKKYIYENFQGEIQKEIRKKSDKY